MELTTIGKQSPFGTPRGGSSSNYGGGGGGSSDGEDEDFEFQWAAIEKLPTFKRLKTSLFDISETITTNNNNNNQVEEENNNGTTTARRSGSKKITDVTQLGATEKRLFINKLIKHIDNDNFLLLHKIRQRIDLVNVKLPTVEVRYKNLCVEAECEIVDGKPLPTLWNSTMSFISYVMKKVLPNKSHDSNITILNNVSGIIKPSRLTLLLGPPGCGKTTFLLALAGKLDKSLKVSGDISYNGYKLNEFVPQKTSAYISQNDLHIPEMTVREIIDFSARCQGVGSRLDITIEVTRREKEAGIVPDPDVDTYMKAIAVQGQEGNLQTDYVLKILGLDICADVVVGTALTRGISGGQKKRLTTAEMIVGPTKALFMDEISTGLDSSTTFQIVTYLHQLVHISDATALVSLLQPAPETFNLFDDVILMADGKIVYHGPCSYVLKYFEDLGFKCPERKGAADFLQEVISKKDQAQYWCHTDLPYGYVSVDQLSQMFRESYLGKEFDEELSKPYDKFQSHKSALSFSKYTLGKWELFKACMARELLLMKRNSFIYVFKTAQLIITAFITMTVFMRAQTAEDAKSASYLMGSMFYALVRLFTNGVVELSLTIIRLPVIYKQRAFYLYPPWAYSVPAAILKVPFSLIDAMLWTAMTYYVIGYSPEVGRFCRQFLLLFSLHQASTSMCRFIAAAFQTMTVATTVGSVILVLMFLLGGFVIPQPSLPLWSRWGFWLSPMSYGEIGISLNEFLAPRWQKPMAGNTTVGSNILAHHGLNFPGYFYWISVGALFGFTILFDVGFILALTYLKPPKMNRSIVSRKTLAQPNGKEATNTENKMSSTQPANAEKRKNGALILPFKPLTMTFKDVQYFVDAAPEMKKNGVAEKRLQLLQDVTGAFRPGVLTALMGVSGAGKTTLMDVLCGRKTRGTIEGDIRINGFPKVQQTFARISGYCEQQDIHSPQITVEESVMFSAWLRLSPDIDQDTRAKFTQEVIATVELDDIKDSLVGIPGESGLSTEQRKRLTIAVELVSNPSVMFMDEPTSGLDARAAAIVMRAVKNVVETGRTTVCTIHQPSIDVFEAFDELVLMKMGGRIIYSGLLGHHSRKLIDYFEAIPGVPKIKDNYNPATWMLEVTSPSAESELGFDFADIYKKSTLFRDTVQLVGELSEPDPGSCDLHFPTRFPQSSLVQFLACLWKQHLSYWRSPEYNITRFLFMIVSSVLFGVVFWQKGTDIKNEQDLFNIMGLMYLAVIFLGINNCSTVLPYVDTERSVLYRETFAGMYSPWAYSFAQVAIEVPYILVQAILFVAITYPTIGYYWTAQKLLWYLYTSFCTFLYFVYLGMLIVSMCSDIEVASILAAALYTILNLFSGFLIPGPKTPKWWSWCYWLCPTAWSLNGLLNSQYGDVKDEVLIFGEAKMVGSFLKEFYGFNHDQLGLVASVLVAFPVAFACLFAYCIWKLNFQKR